jgi:hypothetical protein
LKYIIKGETDEETNLYCTTHFKRSQGKVLKGSSLEFR